MIWRIKFVLSIFSFFALAALDQQKEFDSSSAEKADISGILHFLFFCMFWLANEKQFRLSWDQEGVTKCLLIFQLFSSHNEKEEEGTLPRSNSPKLKVR